MKLWKYSGTFLTATGIIHTIYALFIGKDAFSEMLRNGLVTLLERIIVKDSPFGS